MAPAASRPELLAIVGQTASGKSDLALRLAKELDGEIICADSWTVYKGFDIGTGKPSQVDQKAVKHWLLDLRDANQGFNAPLFQKMANQAIDDIQKRGKLPIIAGGTGLYVDSVLYNYGFIDNVSPQQRKRLDAMDLSELLEAADKQGIDLNEVDTRNKRRVIRAIESGGQKPSRSGLRPGSLLVGVRLSPDKLKQSIESRVNEMLVAGLEKEVKELSVRYGWDTEPMKGVGYRQWQAYFAGSQNLEETRQRVISATIGLAKRQRTWFKRNPDINWFDSIEQAYEFSLMTLST